MLAVLIISLLASPATRPTTRPASAPATQSAEAYLRSIIQNLQWQIADLKQQNFALQKEVKQLHELLPKAKPNPKDPDATLGTGKLDEVTVQIKPGMSRKDLFALLGRNPIRETSDSDGSELIVWYFYYESGELIGNGRDYVGEQVDLRNITPHNKEYNEVAASLTVRLANGVVKDFRKTREH